jgi:hypothetical protein
MGRSKDGTVLAQYPDRQLGRSALDVPYVGTRNRPSRSLCDHDRSRAGQGPSDVLHEQQEV